MLYIVSYNLLVLCLQFFHSHFLMAHLFRYIYFHFPLPASLFHSCLLFCLTRVGLSCHKSNLLGAPKGFLPMSSLCELSGFFVVVVNLQCSALYCHWFNRPPWILLPVNQHHYYFEFYCGRAWHPPPDHFTLFTLARAHLTIKDRIMCDCGMAFCYCFNLVCGHWMKWQLMDSTTPTYLDLQMSCGMWTLIRGARNPDQFPSSLLVPWINKVGNTLIFMVSSWAYPESFQAGCWDFSLAGLAACAWRRVPYGQVKIVMYFESWGWHSPVCRIFLTWNNEWITSALK